MQQVLLKKPLDPLDPKCGPKIIKLGHLKSWARTYLGTYAQQEMIKLLTQGNTKCPQIVLFDFPEIHLEYFLELEAKSYPRMIRISQSSIQCSVVGTMLGSNPI